MLLVGGRGVGSAMSLEGTSLFPFGHSTMMMAISL
jgi:hypothetical protein